MKTIEASAAPIYESDLFKKIEKIGRTCYKSEDKITDDSAPKFVNNLITRQHFAMLEHAVVHFAVTVPANTPLSAYFSRIERARLTLVEHDSPLWRHKYIVTLSLSHLYNPRWDKYEWIKEFRDCFESQSTAPHLWRAWTMLQITETEMINIFRYVGVEDEIKYHLLWTCKFICDRGVSHEIVRHRRSFAQESTRYCNYTQDKFGGELTFVEPSTVHSWSPKAHQVYINTLSEVEKTYFKLIEEGLQPQQARAILPNSLKTEVIMSAFVDEWDHFFDVRSRGTTGAPHPDMKFVADKALTYYEQFLAELLPATKN